EPCGHPHLIRIHREVDERALLEGEKETPSVALCLILLDGIARALTGERVLQLSGDDRQPVHGEYDLDDASPMLSICTLQRRCECHLPGNAKTILSITRGGLGIHPGVGAEVRQPEGLAVAPEAVAQHV